MTVVHTVHPVWGYPCPMRPTGTRTKCVCGVEDGEGTTVPAAGTRLLRTPANAERGPDRQVSVSDLSKPTGA